MTDPEADRDRFGLSREGAVGLHRLLPEIPAAAAIRDEVEEPTIRRPARAPHGRQAIGDSDAVFVLQSQHPKCMDLGDRMADDVGDEAERASRESDNILELRTRDRYRKLLRKIEEALKRVEEGVYGYCEETGEEIGLGRLEARPIATLTVDAQERREMFQKQFRDDR